MYTIPTEPDDYGRRKGIKSIYSSLLLAMSDQVINKCTQLLLSKAAPAKASGFEVLGKSTFDGWLLQRPCGSDICGR